MTESFKFIREQQKEIRELSNDLNMKEIQLKDTESLLNKVTKRMVTVDKENQAMLKLLEVYQLVFSDINQEDLHWIDWQRIDNSEEEYEKTINLLQSK